MTSANVKVHWNIKLHPLKSSPVAGTASRVAGAGPKARQVPKDKNQLMCQEWAGRAFEAIRIGFLRSSPRCRDLVEKGREAFLTTYASRLEEGTAIQWLKFHLSCLFAKCLDQDELPVAPDGQVVPSLTLIEARSVGQDVHGPREDDGCLAPGCLQTACKYVIARAKSKNRRYVRGVCLDLLMCKRGMPPAPKEFVAASKLKHFKCLTTPRPRVPVNPALEGVIRNVVHRVFKGQVLPLPDCCPSFNSSYSGKIREGGAFKTLLNGFYRSRSHLDCQEQAHDALMTEQRDLCRDRLLAKGEDLESEKSKDAILHSGDYCGNICGSWNEHVDFRYWNPNCCLGRSGVTELLSGCSDLLAMVEVGPGVIRSIYGYPDDGLTEEFQQFVTNIIRDGLERPLPVSQVGIREPLKVRVITKGPEAEYFRCLDYQKFMHGRLKNHPVFKWIGKPITEEDWAETFDPHCTALDGRLMVSGDYEQATDNLDPGVSELIWKCICEETRRSDGSRLIDPHDPEVEDQLAMAPSQESWEYQLGKRCLTGHVLQNPEPKSTMNKVDGAPLSFKYDHDRTAPQVWGQLMGSPMSFPILCIANAAACLLSLGYDGKDLSVPVRVNGDDCAFRANPEEYEVWNQLTSSIGLKKSIGKNYYAQDFCIMNSEMREVRGDHWEYVGYLNQGLLRGLVTKGMNAGQTADLSFYDVGPNLVDSWKGIECPKVLSEALEIGLKAHKDVLDQAPKEICWWSPQELGGLGLPCTDVEEMVKSRPFSTQARIIAGYLTSDPEIQASRPTVSRERGPLAAAMEVIRKVVPKVVRPHKQDPDSQSVFPKSFHTGLEGKELLRGLLRVPFTTESWSVSQGSVDNWKLARQWRKWVQPALSMAAAQRRKSEGGAPTDFPFQDFNFNQPHVHYEWQDLVCLSRRSSSRLYHDTRPFQTMQRAEHRLRCQVNPDHLGESGFARLHYGSLARF